MEKVRDIAFRHVELELNELYRDIILDHYRSPRNKRRLEHPTASHEGDNPLCGDEITLELMVNQGMITDIGFSGQGCSISQASASMLTDALHGRSIADALAHLSAFKQLMTMKEEPATDLGDLEALEGVRKFPIRVKCATLAWNVLEGAIEQLDGDVSR